MKENFIDLTDGTRLSVRVNFGTIYYLQKQKGFYRIQKKAEKNKKKLTEEESFELAAYVIYAILRSNGKTVGFDEALSLVPPDTEQLEKVLQVFQEEYDRYVKKTGTVECDAGEINWPEYMVAARKMGMSEEEFWNSDPIFFNECYEVFQKDRRREVEALYVG